MPAPPPIPGPRTEIVGPSEIVGVYAGLTVAPADTPPPAAPLDLPPAPLAPADRYALRCELARGGMGVLILAADTLLGRDVVVKLLREEFAGRRAAERRFLREARINGRLQHPGVVPVYDVGRFPDGRPYFTMEFAPGRTLDAVLADRPDPRAGRPGLLRAVFRVCEVVAYAHARGVIHRDLKPANVMVADADPVRVLDWGLAKVLGRDPDPAAVARAETDPDIDPAALTDPAGTAHGMVVGTPAYMAPEQAAATPGGADERADVFGLGGLLAAVLTGRPPYTGATVDEVRDRAKAGDVAAAHDRVRRSGADPALIDLAVRCLAADPADRPRDAAEVACALAAILMLSPAEPAGWAGRARAAAHFPVRLLQSIW